MWNLVSFAQNHNRGFSEAAGIESGCNAGDTGDENSTPGLGRSPGRRKWQPTPVFLPGQYHGQRTLASYSLWGHKESDMTERLTNWHWHHHHQDNKHHQHFQVHCGLKYKNTKIFVFCRVVHLLQLMNLHWHIIIIWSSWFILGFTLAVVHSMCLNKCIILWGIIQSIFTVLKNPLCSDYLSLYPP